MDLDFIERLGYYFFLAVALVAVPLFTWAAVTTVFEIANGKGFDYLIILGIITINSTFSLRVLGRMQLKNAIKSIVISLISYGIVYLLAMKVTNYSLLGLALIATTVICWEVVICHQNKIARR